MGSCEPGQGRKPAAISSHPHVRRVPPRKPTLAVCNACPLSDAFFGRRGPGMAKSSATPQPLAEAAPRPSPYVVMARRYRPQQFDELIGQEHVARALANAISSGRVGHAYLFSGARGVGKTSAARILAKALNCVEGPTPQPCNRCDICQSISSGEDVDVLEIDGASNRGIDEIRQLRQNVNIRPTRERFKIYIIDEVHMLTREAFNALLKTLEEPPEHVKFIFCTTEPAKIPITILSRCQRFDFAGIRAEAIAKRLQQIVAAEGVEAEPEALELLARRAAGSMRDSQSLLDQLLAFAPARITTADVHSLLGTAGEERLRALVRHVVERDPAKALAEFDAALAEGVEPSQLIEQLLAYFRDAMVMAAGCPAEMLLFAPSRQAGEIAAVGQRLGLDTLLAAMQILDHTLGRMQYSTQGRVLAELALVRLCELEDLAELPSLVAQLSAGGVPCSSGGPPGAAGGTRPSENPPPGQPENQGTPAGARTAPTGPTKNATSSVSPSPPEGGGAWPVQARGSQDAAHAEGTPSRSGPQASPGRAEASTAVRPAMVLSPDNATEVWSKVIAGVPGFAADNARQFARVTLAAPNRLVVGFRPAYTVAKDFCEQPEQKARFEQVLADLTGQRVSLEFAILNDEVAGAPGPSRPSLPPHQRLLQAAQHPMVRRAAELLGARPVRVDEPPADK